MCTPTSSESPFAYTLNASSTSVHPGGSIEHARWWRKSRLVSISHCGTTQSAPSRGSSASVAAPNGSLGMLNRASSADISTSTSPAGPRTRTRCPSGYRWCVCQRSMRTMKRWPMSSCARRVRSFTLTSLPSIGTHSAPFRLTCGLRTSSSSSTASMHATTSVVLR